LTRNTAYQILVFILLIDVGPSYPKVVSVFSTVVWHWQNYNPGIPGSYT